MNYNELKFLAESKNIMIKDLAEKIGMTSNGLKRAVEKQTLPMDKVISLCQILGISPNELLGWETAPGGNYAAHIGGSNTQNSTEAITALSDQLKEKDRQIDRLLKIVEKGKKQ